MDEKKLLTLNSELNIYQRMAAITAEMPTVSKNLNVSAGKTSYKAVSERDVIDAVRPLEAKYGVYSFPFSREIIESQVLESDGFDYKGNPVKKTTFYEKLKTTYRFLNIDKPEECIDITSYSVGLDAGDKIDGKAMTYGDKYCFLKAYHITTGDDPDEKASEETVYKQKSSGRGDTLKAVCQSFGLNTNQVLLDCGWDGITKVSDELIAKALVHVKDITKNG